MKTVLLICICDRKTIRSSNAIKMTSVVHLTPRNKGNISQTPRRLCRKSNAPPETPECFNTVNVETPQATPAKRRISKDKIDELSNLTVAVRVRPMNTNELSCTSVYDAVTVKNNEINVKVTSPLNLGITTNHLFQYDYVFLSSDPQKLDYASQRDVFLTIGQPLLNNAFRGYNACLFAYGQTGSGKSYSMMGENIDMTVNNQLDDYVGIIPRFCFELFERISKLPSNYSATVEVSYFEIYNEKIHDLLAINGNTNERPALKVREHPVWGPYVVNLTQHPVKSFLELNNWLKLGNKHRATAATVMNEKSSRSHSIFSIELSISEMNGETDNSGRRSKVSLVDLAGSERLNTSNINEEHHKQSVSINRSLLTLGKVIAALAEQKKNTFVPYRDSILTWLLRESLGGNSLTSMLATITPASSYLDETLATLRYACQARSIINRARINEDPHDRLIRELRAEVERLRALRQDYEQRSLPSFQDESSIQERDELKSRLSEMESNLEEAQKAWERRFLETKQKQLEQLAEAEKRKAELESHLRVMSTLDTEVSLSPYKSNFLDELEGLLTVPKNIDDISFTEITEEIQETQKWFDVFRLKNLQITTGTIPNEIYIKDLTTNNYAICDINHLKNRFNFNNCPENFLNCLEWQNEDGIVKKSISKDTVLNYLQQIQNATNSLKTYLNEDDENVKNAYNQFYKSLQTFEIAINRSRSKNNKSVKFNI